MEENKGYIDGIEDEDLGSHGFKSFNPNDLRIRNMSITVDFILRKIQYNEVELSSSFNRNQSIWTNEQQSKLIESILIRFPLPVFYFDGSIYDKWLVIDGLQRLNSLKRFVLNNEFKLTGLEFLRELENKSWEQLDRPLQRQLLESQLQCYILEDANDFVKFNIFKRINTTGTPYTNQEIRVALFSQEAEFLRRLAETDEFLKVTQYKVRRERFLDLEFANRFLAFYLLDIDKYYGNDLDAFLNKSLEVLSRLSENDKNSILNNFKKAMNCIWDIFNATAFYKNPESHYINRALFEVLSSQIAKLSNIERDILISRKIDFRNRFYNTIKDELNASLSLNAGSKQNVIMRHKALNKLINQTLSV